VTTFRLPFPGRGYNRVINRAARAYLEKTMQNTAIYNPSFNTAAVAAALAANTPWMPRLRRTLARRWDLIGVLSLMASSAAYGIYALSCTGF